MVYKKTFPVPYILLFYMFATSFLYPQEVTVLEDAAKVLRAEQAEQEEKDYYIRETPEGSVFIQKLSWDAVPDAMRYDVVLEKQSESGNWEAHDTTTTDASTLEVSLFAGKYRYKVLVYNFLDMIEIESEWFEITVIRAIFPRIDSFSPKIFYLEEEKNIGLLRVQGENLSEDTIFTLEMTTVPEHTLTGVIVKKDDKNREVEVQFEIDDIDIGSYILIAKNPGGLSISENFTVVKFPKSYNLNITVGYVATLAPSVTDASNSSDKLFLPLGFSTRITYIPVKRSFGYFGVELAASWIQIKNTLNNYKVSSNLFPLNLNFVYQFPLIKGRLILDTHIGAGLIFFHDLQLDFSNDVMSPPINTIGFSANVGVALQVHLIRHAYAEIGVDYTLAFPKNSMFQMISPSASFVWKF